MDVVALGAVLAVIGSVAGAVIWFHSKIGEQRTLLDEYKKEQAKVSFAITERLHVLESQAAVDKLQLDVFKRDIDDLRARLVKQEDANVQFRISLTKIEGDMLQVVGMVRKIDGKLDTFVDALALREEERYRGDRRRRSDMPQERESDRPDIG